MSQKIKSVLREYGIQTRKSWGQNFLDDEDVVDEIIRAAELNKDDLVLEIGAGSGVLTEKIAPLVSRVAAVEIDKRLCGVLQERLAKFDNVTVIQEDILKVNLREIVEHPLSSGTNFSLVKVIGNLPYYITTPVIFCLLEYKDLFNFIMIMIQKEVAERLTAVPGNKDYGALTLACRYRTCVEMVAQVGKESFYPSPGVDSALLKMRVLEEPPVKVDDEQLFFSLIKSAFAQRRKMLRKALSSASGLSIEKKFLQLVLAEAGIEGERRGETLSLEEYACLSNVLSDRHKKTFKAVTD